MNSIQKRCAIFSYCLGVACSCICAQTPPNSTDDAIFRNFVDPPNSALPRVWWHWMDGNISTEGIKLDLEWMHRVGIGGVTIFEGAINTPQVVPQRLIYMTPEWKHAFNYAILSAKGFGMDVGIASSPGWSETGGPWVAPSHAMKKMVWSATTIEGGQAYKGTLIHPPDTTGYFQNFKDKSSLPQFYADARVIAYRIPKGDKTQAEMNPRITASGGNIDVPGLSDGDIETVALQLTANQQGHEAWVQFDYGKAQMIQAITLATLDDMRSVFDFGNDGVLPRLEASDNGVNFRKITDIQRSSIPQRTTSFKAVTARYFRLVFPPPMRGGSAPAHEITELVLSSGARVNEFEKRAGFANVRDFYAIADPDVANDSVVPLGDIVDLSGKMTPDGRLDWTPPQGKWCVLRIGYSLTGHQNGPAPAEATGLEVDKLNQQYVREYLDKYLKMYSDTVGMPMMGRAGISYLLTDSIEVGPQNWTDNFLYDFKQLRGYDPHLWLPALTGVVIKSPADTDRFLWDFRRTIAQLLAEDHYGTISEEMHRRGFLYYGEALEYHRPSLGDDMEMRSRTDIPMGAMWTYDLKRGPNPTYVADLRGAASIAHVYGQNLVGAESMTSAGPAWSFFPGNLKPNADLQMALGVNRFFIHESTHEPVVDKAPGLTLGNAGQFFTRNETWAELAYPWITYLARSSYLLQQGHYYGDVAYFYGEEGPLTAVFGYAAQKDAPEGFGFDFVNSDVVLHHLRFENGRLVTTGGTSYRVLYLGGTSRRMTLAVLRRLAELVSHGAVIVGDKPIDSPSLADNQKEFHRIADNLWGKTTIQQAFKHKFGKGTVYAGMTANEVLTALQVAPDFTYTKPEPDTMLMFVHRRLTDGDIYFVDNRNNRPETLNATFRIEGKAPELWDATTGISRPASYRIANKRTTVSLQLDPFGAIFVVFRAPTTIQSRQLPRPLETAIPSLRDALNTNWSVHFQVSRGAPGTVHFDHLASWSDNPNADVKYFSGTATYTKAINVPEDLFKPDAHVWLDLGDVENLAEVCVNGKSLAVLWKAPYKVDVTQALKPGSNQLEIKVTDLWVNRLIGDQQPWAIWKYSYTDIRPYDAKSPLLSSGLIGPLRLSLVTLP